MVRGFAVFIGGVGEVSRVLVYGVGRGILHDRLLLLSDGGCPIFRRQAETFASFEAGSRRGSCMSHAARWANIVPCQIRLANSAAASVRSFLYRVGGLFIYLGIR